MKKARLIFCGLLLSVSLVGCGKKGDVKYDDYCQYGDRDFLVIKHFHGIESQNSIIYVDVETKVQYVTFGVGYSKTVVALIDSDGKPILYDGEI